jgi:class 3 adenylate cyclase
LGAGEEGTHERVKTHLVELIDPKIREHHGRIVKTTGDGVLAEFASVVDARAVQAKSRPPWPTASGSLRGAPPAISHRGR